MIKRGLREYPKLNLVANPDGAIPFEDNSFDAVILFGVLTCVPDNESQKELLNNIKKVLKPGGVIYINDFLLNSGLKRWLFYKNAQKKTVYTEHLKLMMVQRYAITQRNIYLICFLFLRHLIIKNL